jgi:ABC-2 type transport system permease protein
MAVYEHTYRGYDGPRAEPRTRFLVVAHYALQEVFSSRLFTGFFIACLMWPLACAAIIYLKYNVEAISILELDALNLIPIDVTFFRLGVLRPQTLLAFVLVMIVGPALVAPDLRNNALALYLSRPLSRTDYVLGKLVVLLGLGSAVTWVPGLSLFLFQSYLADGWLAEHLHIARGILLGSLLWIGLLSLWALAVSAWVKWRPWATIAFLGSIFIFSAVGSIFKLVYGTWWGSVLVFDDVMMRIWDQLFAVGEPGELPAFWAWATAMVFAAFSVWALYRRIRAYEVVS